MYRGLTFSLALLGATCAILSAPAIHAQHPPELTPCLSRPAVANGIRGTQAEAAEPREKVYVIKVTYEGGNGLPESAKARLTRRVEQPTFDDTDGWPLYVSEVVKDAMQDHGYFKATVRPQVGVISSGPMGEQVWVTFHIIQGFQYRLAQVRFTQATVFPVAELRKQVPLRDGDIFDISKIRMGIDALTKLYGAHGYINFVAMPDIRTDNTNRSISVLMQLDVGRQFRVGSVRILGLNRPVSDLKLQIKPGTIFHRSLIVEFYKQNESLLPADASPQEDTTIKQNPYTYTAAILFDFRACPKTAKKPVPTGPVLRRRP